MAIASSLWKTNTSSSLTRPRKRPYSREAQAQCSSTSSPCVSSCQTFVFCPASLHRDVTWRSPLRPVKNLPTWMPGAGFKREAFRIRGLVRAMIDTPYDMVRSAMVSADDDEPSSPSCHVWLTLRSRLRALRGRLLRLRFWKKRMAATDRPPKKPMILRGPLE